MIKKKLTLEEQVARFKNIHSYNVLREQEIPTDGEPEVPPAEEPAMGDVPAEGGMEDLPPADGTEELPDDPSTDLMSDDTGMDDTEELDITDLVNLTKSIKNDLDDQKNNNQNDGIKQEILGKLSSFEMLPSRIEQIINSIENISAKMETLKEPTPVEKLEMRSLDSYPFAKKPNEFFNEKQREMEQSGKNEYVLTKDEIQNYSPDQIVKSFNPDNERNNKIY